MKRSTFLKALVGIPAAIKALSSQPTSEKASYRLSDSGEFTLNDITILAETRGDVKIGDYIAFKEGKFEQTSNINEDWVIGVAISDIQNGVVKIKLKG